MRIILISIALILSLVGCSKNNTNNEFDEFFKLMENDKEYDEKGVFWDGISAKMIKDELDNKYILDGRYGSRMAPETIYLKGFSIKIDTYNNDYKIISNSETSIELETEKSDKDFKVYCKTELLNDSFENVCNQLNNKENIKFVSDELKYSTWYGIKQVKVYLGILDINDEKLAGKTYVIEDDDNNVYQITYAGLGNMNDILMLSSNTASSFTIIVE